MQPVRRWKISTLLEANDFGSGFDNAHRAAPTTVNAAPAVSDKLPLMAEMPSGAAERSVA